MSELIKTYENDELIVYWKPNQCIHAGKCVHGAPTVFNVDSKPWISIDGSSTSHIKEVIDSCPSGALSYKEKRKSMVHIEFEKEGKRAAAYDGDHIIGESTYSESSTMWIIDHTEVDENYGGQGIAGKLVACIVEEARKNGVKVMPLCPFAKREFEKRVEYSDVLLGK